MAGPMMRSVRLAATGRPLVDQQVPIPVPGPEDLLVRVHAAGICHSDAHYRAGTSPVHPLPLTLGHEVAGTIETVGSRVITVKPGDRVCLHYLATCGRCGWCLRGREQFCTNGQMIGKHRDGGFAEYICIPERCAFPLPAEIPFVHGAVMMCSSATSFHALKQARLQSGETVAIFGIGGLGISAVQLAFAFGAKAVYAVDLQPGKLKLAERFGAIPIHAGEKDALVVLQELTDGRGVDVALELIGLPATMDQAVRSLGIRGRATLAGITDRRFEVAPYRDLLNKEAEIIGVSDHLASELPELIRMARVKKLDLSAAVTRTVPLEAAAINAVLDELEQFGGSVRVVVETG